MSARRALAAGLVALLALVPPTGARAQDPHETALFDAQLYDLVEARLEEHLGPAPNVFHELVSDTVHRDLLPFVPAAGRDFWVVSTIGMSFRDMAVPADVPDGWFWKRAELMIALPADWPGLDPVEGVIGGDSYFHPLSVLKEVARYPHLADTAIAPFHTIAFDWPLGPDTTMSAVLIWWPDFLPEDATTIAVDPERVVNLFQIIPIYPVERDFAVSEGSEALYDLLKGAGATRFYDLQRKPVVSGP